MSSPSPFPCSSVAELWPFLGGDYTYSRATCLWVLESILGHLQDQTGARLLVLDAMRQVGPPWTPGSIEVPHA